jgi:hypothetical protein
MELEFEDTFDGDALDTGKWLPWYLPHWSSRERSAARYELRDGLLRLLIDAGTEPWCPELDGDVRVSSLQTGQFSGPLGSQVGTHAFVPHAVVREEQENARLYTPHHGRIEVRARATDDPDAMVSLWMPGYEGGERSGEICVFEIFGRDVRDDHAVVGLGVHPFGDSSLEDDFRRVTVPIDARDFHVYAADWTAERVVFHVDGEAVATVEQSPSYPLQLMLGLYAFAPATTPKELVVDWVRGYAIG